MNLEGLWRVFDPTIVVDPRSKFYIPRQEAALNKLAFRLERASGPMHAFRCGHAGSGKTTELNRLRLDERIRRRACPSTSPSSSSGRRRSTSRTMPCWWR